MLNPIIDPHLVVIDNLGKEVLGDWNSVKNSKVTNILLRFREIDVKPFPDFAQYFFCNKIIQHLGGSQPLHCFVIGYNENGILKTHTYSLPQLILIETENRNFTEYEEFCSKPW